MISIILQATQRRQPNAEGIIELIFPDKYTDKVGLIVVTVEEIPPKTNPVLTKITFEKCQEPTTTQITTVVTTTKQGAQETTKEEQTTTIISTTSAAGATTTKETAEVITTVAPAPTTIESGKQSH